MGQLAAPTDEGREEWREADELQQDIQQSGSLKAQAHAIEQPTTRQPYGAGHMHERETKEVL